MIKAGVNTRSYGLTPETGAPGHATRGTNAEDAGAADGRAAVDSGSSRDAPWVCAAAVAVVETNVEPFTPEANAAGLRGCVAHVLGSLKETVLLI